MRSVAGLLLAVVAIVWLVAVAGRAGAPFGDSDEGINGAVWSYNAQSLRELGPIESRLGGVRLDDTAYATHPPGIVLTTALAQGVAGDGPWSDRAPAWIGTLVAAFLLFLVLRALRVDPVPAAAATIAGFGCHMTLVYGAMLDTPVTALPFGVAVLLAFTRRSQGRPWPAGAEVALAAAAALSGWQGALLAGLAGLTLLARAPRGRRAARRAVPYLGGCAAGAALAMGWAWWAYGSLDELVDKYTRRTGGAGRAGTAGELESVGFGDMMSFQVPWLAQLLGLGLVGLVLCAVSLRDPRWRAPGALALATVLGYALLFREAAAGHQYWLYWSLVPIVLGFGYVAGPGLRRLASDLSLGVTGRSVLAVVLAVVVVAVNMTRPDQAGDLVDRGHRAVELVQEAELPGDQEALLHVGQPQRPDAWVLRETGREVETLHSVAELEDLADEHPEHLVLVLGGCSSANAELCDALGLRLLQDDRDPDPPRLLRASQLAGETAAG